ncbi:hypothetical protein R1sor_022045 [Riccia sorocarpa]|uniref:50S ribosomal protein L35 n=1 Tax=Riccia sorocarpa TaxID=122646 RepID=A0ABD3GN03_9MARC
MAMAMAAGAVGVGTVRVAVSASAPAASTSSRAALLCSSFTGLSVSSWKKNGIGAEMKLPVVQSPTTTRHLICFPIVAKLKTHKAAAKRFRVTGSGKIVRRQAGRAHLLRKKTTKRKNRLSKKLQVNRRDYDNVIGALPYLKVNRSN